MLTVAIDHDKRVKHQIAGCMEADGFRISVRINHWILSRVSYYYNGAAISSIHDIQDGIVNTISEDGCISRLKQMLHCRCEIFERMIDVVHSSSTIVSGR